MWNVIIYNIKIGLDWFINKQEIFGILINGNVSQFDWVNYSWILIVFVDVIIISQILIVDNINDS